MAQGLRLRRPAPTPDACWCEPGRDGKCWERSLRTEMVPHILKGGEDSIGYNEAIQRVYFNIGSCAEQCWINHLTDLRAADPEQRNYGQTPFDIGQCRRDCGAFRAIEDRLDDIKAFFLTARPTDLWRARGLASPRDLEVQLDAEHAEFADSTRAPSSAAARSSPRTAPAAIRARRSSPTTTDFTATDPADPTLRLDWLGNDEVAPASEIGTYPARALHSNHMQSRVWAEYASLDAHDAPGRPAAPGGDEGRRPRLLPQHLAAQRLGARALHAQQRHRPGDLRQARAARRSTSTPRPTSTPKAGRSPTRPTAGRSTRASRAATSSTRRRWQELLNPDRRIPKMFVLDRDIVIDIAPEGRAPRPRASASR